MSSRYSWGLLFIALWNVFQVTVAGFFITDPHVVMTRDVKKLCLNFVSIGVANVAEELRKNPKRIVASITVKA